MALKDPPAAPAPVSLRRNRSFTMLWTAETVSGLGTEISTLALPLTAVFYLHASTFDVGLLATIESVCFVLIGLPTGPYVDRHPKRPILIICNAGRLAALGSVPIASAVHCLTIGQLYAVTLTVGLLTVPFTIAYQSYLPYLVDESTLLAGSARMQASSSTNSIVGPSLAGILIGLVSAPIAVLGDACSYFISSLFIFSIPASAEPTPEKSHVRYLIDISEGLRFVLRSRVLSAIAGANATTGLCEGIDSAVIVVFLGRTLHASPLFIGLIYSICAVGGLCGALVSERVVNRFGTRRVLIGSIGLASPFLLISALAQPGWSTVLVGVSGLPVWAGLVVYSVVGFAYRQSVCPIPLRGRVNATIQFINYLFTPIGALIGATVASLAGPRVGVIAAGAGLSLSFLWLLRLPSSQAAEQANTLDESKGTIDIPDDKS